MSGRESIRSDLGGESARLRISLKVLLDSDNLIGSVEEASMSRLELGWGTVNISLKTGDAWDSRLLRTRS